MCSLARYVVWVSLLFGLGIAQAQPASPAIATLPSPRPRVVAVIEPKAREYITELSQKCAELRSYSDTTTLEVQDTGVLGATTAAQMRAKVNIAFERPDKLRLEGTNGNGAFLAVGDGKTLSVRSGNHPGSYAQRATNVWIMRQASQEVELSLESNSVLFDKRFLFVNFLQGPHLLSVTTGEDVDVEGAMCHVVIAKQEPLENGTSTNTTLFIGANDGLLHRLVADIGSGNFRFNLVETHSNIRANPTLDAATWSFTAPPEAKRVDTFLRYDPHKDEPKVKVGEVVPDFKATTVDGKPLSLETLRGQVVLLYFYHPRFVADEAVFGNDSGQLSELARKYDIKGLRIIGVATVSRREDVRPLIEKEAFAFPTVLDYADDENGISAQFGQRYYNLGWLYLLDRQGKLVRIARDLSELEFSGDLETTLDPK